MLTEVIVKTSEKNPSVGYFLLNGLNTVGTQRLDFSIAEGEATRQEAVEKAREARCAIAGALLNTPYFKAVSIFSVKNVDCICLVLMDGKKWSDAVGRKSTIETSISSIIMKNYKNLKAVIGRDENVDPEELKNKMDSFVRNHPLQTIVKKDKGSLSFGDFDPVTGALTLHFGGNCASSTTCVGSQISSRNWISRDAMIEFPNQVRQMKFS